MASIRITIKTDGFQPVTTCKYHDRLVMEKEVGRILYELAELCAYAVGPFDDPLRDSDGNVVGKVEVIE